MSQAVKSYLESEYQIAIVNVFTDDYLAFDPIHNLSSGVYGGERVYDYFLQTQSIACAHFYCACGKIGMRWLSGRMESSLSHFIEEYKPDLLLSVMPFVNGSIYRVAQKLDMPFGIIPCDLDVTNYLNGMPYADYPRFLFGLSVDDPLVRSVLKGSVADEQVRIVGFPVRPGFLQEHDLSTLKAEFEIPDDKPVIMVLMGSAGSKATLRYAKAFARRVKRPVHLVLCLGRNGQLREKIDAIDFPEHISVTTLGFTDRIHDYMAVSDLLITKAGPTSIIEAVAIGVPMIIDRTKRVLWWEKMNADFVKHIGCAQELRSFKMLPQMIDELLDPEVQEAMRGACHAYRMPDARQEIMNFVHELEAMV